jgi:hypothetical protein
VTNGDAIRRNKASVGDAEKKQSISMALAGGASQRDGQRAHSRGRGSGMAPEIP